MVELTEFLVKSIVSKPDMVSVKQFEDNEDITTIQVLVDKDDMGLVIGKRGSTISAIRTIVQASSYMQHLPKVRIDVDSF